MRVRLLEGQQITERFTNLVDSALADFLEQLWLRRPFAELLKEPGGGNLSFRFPHGHSGCQGLSHRFAMPFMRNPQTRATAWDHRAARNGKLIAAAPNGSDSDPSGLHIVKATRPISMSRTRFDRFQPRASTLFYRQILL